MIRAENLNKTYDRGSRNANRVLRDVTLELPEKGFVCILGPSGCGKTSLLNAIGGLDDFDNGTLTVEDVTVRRSGTRQYENQRNRSFGYIFQNYYLMENHSAAYNVYLGLHSLDLSHREKLRRVKQALEAVEMGRYARRLVGELSGGQQQRIAIARALARRPRVIFADEPTGNLDEANTRNICGLLRRASRDSLVVMVTHEERIARFFADRIITLDQGMITSDTTQWERTDLTVDSDREIYAGEFREERPEAQGLCLRLLAEPGAEPVALTVVAMKDRLVLKLTDRRQVLLTQEGEAPVILEGIRPPVRLEELTEGESLELLREPPPKQTRAGKGITPRFMAREAGMLRKGKSTRRLSLRLFLTLLTVLTAITVGDFVNVSRIAPEEYVTADSHVIELTLDRGPQAAQAGFHDGEGSIVWQYHEWLMENLDQCVVLGQMYANPTYSAKLVYQMDLQRLRFPAHSTVPLEFLEESTLLYGRMPRNSSEIVVDRLVLEAAIQGDGILQNMITDVRMFLDETLSYGKRGMLPKIVGICDSGERSVYMATSAMLALSLRGVSVIGLSEFQALHPGEYDHVTLDEGECLAITDNAGVIYERRVDTYTSISTYRSFLVKDAVSTDRTWAYFVVADPMVAVLTAEASGTAMRLYCPDKNAAKAFLAQPSQWEEADLLQVTVNDRYAREYQEYLKQTQLRTNGRVIVTVTVVAICMVMLALLCRAQLRDRHSLASVYRLLGIPGRKLCGIFVMEAVMTALTSVLPAGALTWAAVWAIRRFTELELPLILTWHSALAVCAAITVYYLAVVLLPLIRLLRLPPARLATKYDI